ncbi:MAG: hypothetical protein LBO69_09295 [Ignavibacteria bacterium]|nr:hypothetical protein [Ignavibacteria bacterium]
MNAKIIQIAKYMAAVASCILIVGCNDLPTEVGTAFLQDTIGISIVAGQENRIMPNAYSYAVTPAAERNTGNILIGINGNTRAAALIRFNVPIGMADIADRIENCQLHLIPNTYAIGDTISNQLNFNIMEVTSHWTQETTTPEDVLSSDLLYAGGMEIAKFSGTINRTDSLTDTLIMDFPKDLLAQWLHNINDGTNITDTVWGIAIIPQAGSNIINAFKSYSSAAATPGTFIKIRYWDTAHTTLDSFNMLSAEETTFAATTDEYNTEDIVLQGATRTHSRFNFNLSEVPQFASVNLAELTLTLDEANTVLGNKPVPEQIYMHYFDDTTSGEKLTHSQAVIVGNYDSTSKTYTFRSFLNYPLNKFVRQQKGIGTLVLTFGSLEYEYNQLNKLAFYGLNATDIAKRPKFRIVYSAE